MTRMTRILTPVAALALGLMAIVPAIAQGIDATIDVNGDGKYSYPELQGTSKNSVRPDGGVDIGPV